MQICDGNMSFAQALLEVQKRSFVLLNLSTQITQTPWKIELYQKRPGTPKTENLAGEAVKRQGKNPIVPLPWNCRVNPQRLRWARVNRTHH